MASVEIYTRKFCSYCHFAKELLSRKGVAFHEIDVGLRIWIARAVRAGTLEKKA